MPFRLEGKQVLECNYGKNRNPKPKTNQEVIMNIIIDPLKDKILKIRDREVETCPLDY